MRPSPREPLFNLPWPVVLLVSALILAHGLRVLLGAPAEPFALASGDLAAGRWTGLLTHMFTHASWTHVLLNSVSIVVFGAPTVRYMGDGWRGGSAFLAFFLACGLISSIGYAAIHPNGGWALIGASGAAFSLFGAVTRLIQGGGRIGPLFGRTVLGMTVFVIIANAALGIFGLTPGASGMPVAWEAHVFGYLAGLFLIGLFARLAGVPAPSHEAITH